jgi:hypothetical protein
MLADRLEEVYKSGLFSLDPPYERHVCWAAPKRGLIRPIIAGALDAVSESAHRGLHPAIAAASWWGSSR